MIAAKLAGHEQHPHIFFAQRPHRQDSSYRRVDAAGQAEYGLFKIEFFKIVADTHNERIMNQPDFVFGLFGTAPSLHYLVQIIYLKPFFKIWHFVEHHSVW